MGRIAEQKAAIPETIPTEIAGRYSGGDRATADGFRLHGTAHLYPG